MHCTMNGLRTQTKSGHSQEFLEAMADPSHPEHGSSFDPTVFEWERVNQWLKEIKV